MTDRTIIARTPDAAREMFDIMFGGPESTRAGLVAAMQRERELWAELDRIATPPDEEQMKWFPELYSIEGRCARWMRALGRLQRCIAERRRLETRLAGLAGEK